MLAAGALVSIACQEEPVSTAKPQGTATATTAAAPKPAARPTSTTVAGTDTPFPQLASKPTPAPTASLRSALPDPTPSAVAVPSPIPASTLTGAPIATPIPAPTLNPTPVVEACRAAYSAPIVPGPSEPDLPHDNDSVFQSLTLHPADADTVLLGTERNGMLKSVDGGESWSRYRAGLMSESWGYPEVWDIDISTTNPDIIMAATLGSPGPPTGRGVDSGVYRSTDGGVSWTVLNCGFSTSRVTSIRIDPNNSDVAIAGLEGGLPSFTGPGSGVYYPGGIYRTEDGGENWNRVDIASDDGRNGYWVMRIVPEDTNQMITFGINREDLNENLGFIRGNGSGSEWELVGPEMRHKYIDGFDISADGTVIYANERDVYHGWVSRDGGGTWNKTPNLQVSGPIAVSPMDPDLVLYGSFDSVRRSTDGLNTAAAVMDADRAIREIVFAPSDPDVVYAETDGYVLYRSDDAGLTWRQLVRGREEVLNVQP